MESRVDRIWWKLEERVRNWRSYGITRNDLWWCHSTLFAESTISFHPSLYEENWDGRDTHKGWCHKEIRALLPGSITSLDTEVCSFLKVPVDEGIDQGDYQPDQVEQPTDNTMLEELPKQGHLPSIFNKACESPLPNSMLLPVHLNGSWRSKLIFCRVWHQCRSPWRGCDFTHSRSAYTALEFSQPGQLSRRVFGFPSNVWHTNYSTLGTCNSGTSI